MLTRLKISNYALISSIEIELGKGLSIITGETGSGKSIMLGALSLLLGGRGEQRSLRDKERKAVIEAVFSDLPAELKPVLENAEIDWAEGEMIVRREILPSGRSRAFINDSPVTIQLLSEITPRLIDIHSQHHNLLLADQRQQLRIIDAVAANDTELRTYRDLFGRYVELRTRLEKLKREAAANRQNREFLAFQLEQLDKLKPRRGELEKIEKEFDICSDSTEIKENLSGASSLLGGLDSSAIARAADARGMLSRVDLSLFGESASDLAQRLESVYVEIKDIYETLEDLAQNVQADPRRLEAISQRMNALYEAQTRFHVADNDALVELHESIRRKLSAIDGGADFQELETELRQLAGKLKEAALRLSDTRLRAAEQFSAELTSTVRSLGLPNLRFSVMLTRGKLGADGMDSASFICSFNKNQEMQPLEKVASGGEISRLMLSLKGIMCSRLKLPTVIFDEIDTGVSGEIADRMGSMMRDIGKDMQVLAITHLPQVAAKGAAHYHVYKTDDKDTTVSRIERLSEEDRIMEIASMLSGEKVNAAAMQNARSLLGIKS